MTVLASEDRIRRTREQIELLCTVRSELESAMLAIAQNRLSDLEESIAEQEAMTARLRLVLGGEATPGEESRQRATGVPAGFALQEAGLDQGQDLSEELWIAGKELQQTARIYARLLEHSSHSAALMASLLGSMRERGREVSGSGTRYQTWSCQI